MRARIARTCDHKYYTWTNLQALNTWWRSLFPHSGPQFRDPTHLQGIITFWMLKTILENKVPLHTAFSGYPSFSRYLWCLFVLPVFHLPDDFRWKPTWRKLFHSLTSTYAHYGRCFLTLRKRKEFMSRKQIPFSAKSIFLAFIWLWEGPLTGIQTIKL